MLLRIAVESAISCGIVWPRRETRASEPSLSATLAYRIEHVDLTVCANVREVRDGQRQVTLEVAGGKAIPVRRRLSN
jgi:hypothetical protein